MSCLYLVPPFCPLALILGRILSKIYALDALAASRSRKNLPMLIEELQQWFRTLPPPMRFNEANSNAASPDVLVLHMQYWSANLLLYRRL